jgi:hypothetical protein
MTYEKPRWWTQIGNMYGLRHASDISIRLFRHGKKKGDISVQNMKNLNKIIGKAIRKYENLAHHKYQDPDSPQIHAYVANRLARRYGHIVESIGVEMQKLQGCGVVSYHDPDTLREQGALAINPAFTKYFLEYKIY